MEAVMAYSRALSQHLPTGNEEKQNIRQNQLSLGQDLNLEHGKKTGVLSC
jgi:hypothetical protein